MIAGAYNLPHILSKIQGLLIVVYKYGFPRTALSHMKLESTHSSESWRAHWGFLVDFCGISHSELKPASYYTLEEAGMWVYHANLQIVAYIEIDLDFTQKRG